MCNAYRICTMGVQQNGTIGESDRFGVCDRKVPVRLKGCIHKAIVRPAMLYGMETVPLNKSMVKKMDMAEMKMLRWEIGLKKEKRFGMK